MKELWNTFLGYLAVGFLAIPWSLVAAWLGISGSHWAVLTTILVLNVITTYLILRRFKFMRRVFTFLGKKDEPGKSSVLPEKVSERTRG